MNVSVLPQLAENTRAEVSSVANSLERYSRNLMTVSVEFGVIIAVNPLGRREIEILGKVDIAAFCERFYKSLLAVDDIPVSFDELNENRYIIRRHRTRPCKIDRTFRVGIISEQRVSFFLGSKNGGLFQNRPGHLGIGIENRRLVKRICGVVQVCVDISHDSRPDKVGVKRHIAVYTHRSEIPFCIENRSARFLVLNHVAVGVRFGDIPPFEIITGDFAFTEVFVIAGLNTHERTFQHA